MAEGGAEGSTRFLIDRLAVVGVGLMGGAVGMRAREAGAAREVVGLVRRREAVEEAESAGAVDRATLDPAGAVRGAGLVIVATGVSSVGEVVEKIAPFLDPGTVVTDVGSTKTRVLREVSRSLKTRSDVHFVGSHPLCGSEKKSVAHSCEVRMAGATVVVAGGTGGAEAVRFVLDFWAKLGMHPVEMEPEEHDRILARTSHLPHLVSAALSLVPAEEDGAFAAGGFRDVTRLAEGDPALWSGIVEQNRGEILGAVDEFLERMNELRRRVAGGDAGAVEEFLRSAAAARRRILRSSASAGQGAPDG